MVYQTFEEYWAATWPSEAQSSEMGIAASVNAVFKDVARKAWEDSANSTFDRIERAMKVVAGLDNQP